MVGVGKACWKQAVKAGAGFRGDSPPRASAFPSYHGLFIYLLLN